MEMNREMRAEFARRLIEKFNSLGWTQEKLAEESGVGLRTVSGFARGENVPNGATLGKFARAMGVDPEEQRAHWAKDVALFADLMGIWLSTLPEAEREQIMRTWAEQIATTAVNADVANSD